MADYVVAQAAVLIVPTLDKFREKLMAELRKQQKLADASPIKIDAELNSKKVYAEFATTKKALESQDITLQAKVDTRALTEIRHKYEDLAREMKKALVLNLKIVGMSLLPQLASGLAAVNASMVQLTRTAALLPGVLAAAASSIGTIATGLSGVKQAFKEYSDGQKNAAQEGLKARNAAINVKNAYRDLGRSFKDAKRNLEDLNAELRGAPLDEADAIIALAEARQEAADKAGKSGLQQQKDALQLLRAENALVDVRMRNSRLIQDVAEANAKGVAGADNVAEAAERVAKATDEAATQTTKLSDSLKELSPNAKSFVQAVIGMSSEWEAFKNATQDRLFAGLDQEITQLAQVSLPTLQKGFGAIADSLNGNVKAAFQAIESETNQGFLDKIFGDTAAAQANLSKVFDPFIDSLLRLSATGTDFLPRLVDGLVDLTTRFDNFIIRAESDGSLNNWINQGIEEFKALGNTIINLGSMLNSLSEAFTGSGGQTFLQVLEDGTEKLANFLDSKDGQETLKKFFTDAREEFRQWGPLLDQLPGLISNLADAGQAWANLLLPFLTEAGEMLAQHPGLVKTIFAAYVGWNTIVPTIKGVKSAVEGLTVATQFINNKVFNNEVGLVSRYISSMDNLKKGIGRVTDAIVSPTGLLVGATALATYLTYQMVNAHDAAAAAAKRQKDDLDELTTSLDNVTGAATRATIATIGKDVRAGNNAATNLSYGDLTSQIKIGTPEQFAQNIASGNVDAALAQVPGAATAKDVENTEWWKDSSGSLQKANITSSIVADALNGEPEAKAKFDEWQLAQMRLLAPSGFGGASKATLQGLENIGLQPSVNDLLDLQKQLPQDMQKSTALRQEVYAGTADVQAGKSDIQQQNQFFGRYQLKPNSEFSPLGVLDQPQVNESGGGLTTRTAPPKGSPEEDKFRQDGVMFEDNGIGGYNVKLTLEAVNKYFQKYATGGLVSGRGTGTSDSNLALLSRGEYVINAASTKKHLPLLESINGGKVPGYKVGGPVKRDPVFDGGDPSSDPGLPAVGSFLGSAFGALTGPGSFTSGLFPSGQTDTQYSPNGLMPTDANASALYRDGLQSGVMGGTLLGSTSLNPVTPQPARPGLGSLLGSDPSLEGAPYPYVAKPSAPLGGTADTSTDSRINPNTTVHSGTKPSAGPGNAVPHQVAGLPARPGPYQAPVISQNTSQIAASTGLPPSVVTSSVPSSLLATPIVGPLAAEAAYQLATYEGLPVGTAINYGQAGFPDWVYQVGAPFGMVASTYAGHQEGGGTNKGIDWAPDGVAANTPQGAEMMTRYAKYLASLGIMEQVIYKNPFTGETVGVANGKLVGPGTDQPQYYGADWDGHTDHIHTRQSKVIPTPAQLQAMGISSPSNMAMAGTPTGVQLPQLSYAPGGGLSGGLGSGAAGGVRMPTPEEYAKYVTESWQSTLQDMVKNAGQIAIGFLGSFLGLDLSKITGLANSVMGGIDLPGMQDGEGGESGDAASQLGALPSVDQIIQAAGALPPEYQQQYVDAAMKNPAQAGSMLDQMLQAVQGGGMPGGSVQYDPAKGAEQWRPLVRSVLKARAAQYGITNLQAWEDALVRQIDTESKGNPNVDNLNDTDGKGGTQQVFGLGQFLPTTFAAHNVTGGDIRDPAAVIPAMIDYVATKYGMDETGAPKQIGRGVGYASGGMIKGMGSGKSDSMIARVSNGEYVVKAAQARKHMGLLDAINGGRLPGFAEGGPIINPMFPPPPPPPVPPVTTPPPPPAPVPPDPGGPAADTAAGIPAAPTPVTENAAPGDAESATLKDVGAAVGGLGEAISGVADGASAPAGGNPEGDPRAEMGQAPQNLDHNKPAVSAGIQAAGSAISGAISTAMSVGSAGASLAAPGAGAGLGSASGIISGLIGAGAGAVSGAVNVLSSLGVGTVTPSTSTAGAYGAPLLPQTTGQDSYKGPSVVNNWNGGVHTQNNEEFYKLQQRRELQNAAPYLPQR